MSESYSEDEGSSYSDDGEVSPDSPSKTRKRKLRRCCCCVPSRPLLPGAPSQHTNSIIRRIGSCFLFMTYSILSCIVTRVMGSTFFFPFLGTLLNAIFVFGPVILLYQIDKASIMTNWASAIVSWAMFLVNTYIFFYVSIPRIHGELGTRRVVYRFIDTYLSATMSNAVLGYSIWVLDSSVGKADQFQALGDENVNGYLAFLRIWVSTMSTVWGPGHIPNLPVGALALLWNMISLFNSVIFLILMATWAPSFYATFYTATTTTAVPKRHHKKKRGSRHSTTSGTVATPVHTPTIVRDDEVVGVITFPTGRRKMASGIY